MIQQGDEGALWAGWRMRAGIGLAVVLLLGLGVQGVRLARDLAPQPLLLLPMIGALDNCLLSRTRSPNVETCAGDVDSAAGLIDRTLATLGPQVSANGAYELGYTLNVPLLRLFNRSADGRWMVDDAAAQRVANTIARSPRPMLLYLFSTHFAVGGALEASLGTDPRNLAVGPTGRPLDKDRYYHLDIYPWSVASRDNDITRMREQAMGAVLDSVCRLSSADQEKIKGVTVLGELHHLFPDFQSGMGVSADYVVSDYSAASVREFQRFVRARFTSLDALNAELGSDYERFDQVVPPGRNIRKQRLTRYEDHIDSFAGGILPIAGWAHVRGADAPWIHVFVNGLPVARVRANQGRQDVLESLPSVGSADVGWRYDLDYSSFPPGMHRIDVALEQGNEPLQYLTGRSVGVIGRDQKAPQPVPQATLPPMSKVQIGTSFWVDTPPDQLSLYYNPLVNLWHEFRQTQVTRHLSHFADRVKNSCLGRGPVYTHQIVPFVNPGWDSTRFGIDDSLKVDTGLALGISLYGRATYGPEVLQWLQNRRSRVPGLGAVAGSRPYGITEFHPLKAMGPTELQEVLDAHHREGARYISFFMEPRIDGRLFEPGMNLFSFDPQNSAYGSKVLYQSVAQILRSPPSGVEQPGAVAR
ncbi:hypothetical protein [Paracidovorax sp. MALMAid1276]|uniref:hypothetical protein n=1 Tax=Paracidovorax sp. MALMAid1276 TaxID=3411631 RepID=UPI003B9B7CE9